MPVLARTFEAAGMATVLVTNMPYWSEKVGVPRTLAAQLPFGHILGKPGDTAQQLRLIEQALAVLENAKKPGTIMHSDEVWPGPHEEEMKLSHAETPPPITSEMGKHIGKFLRTLRRGRK